MVFILSLLLCRLPHPIHHISALAGNAIMHQKILVYSSMAKSTLLVVDIVTEDVIPITVEANQEQFQILASDKVYKFSQIFTETSSWEDISFSIPLILAVVPQNGQVDENSPVEVIFLSQHSQETKVLGSFQLFSGLENSSGFVITNETTVFQLNSSQPVKSLQISPGRNIMIQYMNNTIHLLQRCNNGYTLSNQLSQSMISNVRFLSAFFLPSPSHTFTPYTAFNTTTEQSDEILVISVVFATGLHGRSNSTLPNATSTASSNSGLLLWNWVTNEHRIYYNNINTLAEKRYNSAAITSASLPTVTVASSTGTRVQSVLEQYVLQPHQSLLLLGIDSHHRLYVCDDLWQSEFAGAMYPVHYQLVEHVPTYREVEDEFDNVIKHSDKEAEEDFSMKKSMLLEVRKINRMPSSKIIPCNLESLLHDAIQNRASFSTPFVYSVHPNHALQNGLHTGLNESIPDDDIITATAPSLSDDIASNNFRKKEVFSAGVETIIPVPPRIASGEYVEKILRAQETTEQIRTLLQDSAYKKERFEQLSREAVEITKASVEMQHIRTKKMLEKKKQRELVKEKAVNQLLEIVVNSSSGTQSVANYNFGVVPPHNAVQQVYPYQHQRKLHEISLAPKSQPLDIVSPSICETVQKLLDELIRKCECM